MKDVQSLFIPVDEFREILIWPFRLALAGEGGRVEDEVVRVRKALGASPLWQKIPDPLGHLSAEPVAEYQEFVYFHPFVRRFLYGDGDPAPFTLHGRVGVAAVDLSLDNRVTGPFDVRLDVERANLYLFDNGNAVLALEVAAGCVRENEERPARIRSGGDWRPMALAHAQVILERFRRAFPPYWLKNGKAGLSPGMVGWIGEGLEAWSCMPGAAECVRHVVKHRQPPLASHWARLLEPLDFGGGPGPRWVQAVDDRIPVMAYVAVPNPEAISRGDWVRLAMLDEADAAVLPYGQTHLREFEARHCHDAFWDPGPGGKTTRYLVSGHGFMAVGRSGDWMFANVVRDHVRRHYFQLGLIAHFQTASLLTLSHRLARAVKEESDREGRDQDILRDVLDFTHRFWFPQVSGHVQARELYTLWRGHLGVDALHAEVMREAQDLTAYLDGRADRDAADAAANLNLIATIGLTGSLVAGILGMNVWVPGQAGGGEDSEGLGFALSTLAVVVGLVGAALLGLSQSRRGSGRLWWLGVLFLGIAFVAVLARVSP